MEPHVVLRDILKSRGKRLVPPPPPPKTRRTRSDNIPILSHEYRDDKAIVVPKMRRRVGRPLSRVKWVVAVHAILRNKDDVVGADGQLVPSYFPVWNRIKRALDGKITVQSLYRIAEKDIYKELVGNPGDVIGTQTAIADSAAAAVDIKEEPAAAAAAAPDADDFKENNTEATSEEFTRVHGGAMSALLQQLNGDENSLVESNRGRENSAAAPKQQQQQQQQTNGDEDDNAATTTEYGKILSNLVRSIDCLNKEIKELRGELRERNKRTERGAAAAAAAARPGHTVITCGCSTR